MKNKLKQSKNKKIPKLRFSVFSGALEQKVLGDVSEYKNGGSYEDSVVENGKYNLITLNSIDIDGKLKSNHKKVNSSDWFLQKGDLIMVLSDVAHGNFLGLVDVIPEDNKYVLNQRMGLLRKRDDGVDLKFLRTYINKKQKYFKLHGQGSSQQNLAKGDILKFNIILPRLAEQQKISEFLGSVDEWIENLRSQKESLELYKKEIMQKIFSQEIRFKDDNGKDFSEWEERRLRDLCEKVQSGGTPISTKKQYYDGLIPFLSIADMTRSGKYIRDTEKKITQEGLKNSSAWIVPINSIIYSMYASVGLVGINKISLATSQAMINLILNKTIVSTDYIYYYLSFFKQFVHRFIETGTQGNLNAQIVKNIIVPLPSLLEQQKISEFLTVIDNLIESKEQQSSQAEQWKSGLMQEMFV